MYKSKPIERDFIINGKDNSICGVNGLPTLTMLSKNGYGYIEFAECHKKLNKNIDINVERDLFYKFAKLDVICDKTCTVDMHQKNVIIVDHNKTLDVVPIDSSDSR